MKSLLIVTLMVFISASNAQAEILTDIKTASSGTTTVSLSSNFTPVIELTDLLRAAGKKVEIKIHSINGMELAIVTVNGKQLAPYVISCNACEVIVFEY